MIDARIQVKELLETVCSNVKAIYPEGDVVLPIVTYAEVTNVNIGKWQDRIEYQIDVRDGTFSSCLELVQSVDGVMTGAGWNRTYESPDSNTREGKDLYHKVLNYSAVVDTYHNNILGGF